MHSAHNSPHVQSALSSLAETNDPEVIKTRAKEDANRDVSRLRWFGSGVGIMGGTFCGILCCVGITALSNTSEPPDTLMTSFYTSMYLIPIVGLTAIYRHSPSPPAERLIGKSPLYVSIYTDTYQSHARSIRTKMAASGCCLVAGALGVLGGVALMLDSTTNW